MVTADISVEISGGDDGEYEPIQPIKSIDFGFYVVPNDESFTSYITSVDQGLLTPHEHYDISGYISSEAYLSAHLPKLVPSPHDEPGIMLSVYDQPLQTSGDYCEKITTQCSLQPYKDAIRWRIDPFSTREFPYNVGV